MRVGGRGVGGRRATTRCARPTAGTCPTRYNIAADVCDKHPRDKPAMIWESFDGSARELDWGELQDLANQAAHTLAARGIGKGDRVAVVLPATPETAAIFFGVWKLGAILLSMSVLYGDDGIRHRLSDSEPRLLVTDAANAPRFDRPWAPDVLVLEQDTLDGRLRPTSSAPTRRPTTPPSSTTRRGRRAWRRASSTRTATSSRTRSSSTATRSRRRALPRHGRVGVGGRDRAAARPLAARRGAVRLPARGRLRPAQAARLPEPPRGHERLHDADGDALDDGDRRRRDALPAAVPPRLLGRRAAESGGDPLVPEAVRRHRARLLRAHRVVSARRELPLPRGARGLDGQADAGLGRADPRRGRAAGRAGRARRDLPPRPLEPALSARLLAERRGGRGGVRRRVVPHEGRRRPGRGRLLLVRRTRRRRDHRGRLPDRPVRGRVGLPRARGRARGRSGRLTRRAARQRGQGVHRPRRGHTPSDELADEIKRFVRERLSAYAYPRRIEFVPDLPKTLTGKIRRIELRQLELDRASTSAGL